MACKNNYFLTLRGNFRGESLTLHPFSYTERFGQQNPISIDYDGLNLPPGTNLPPGYDTGRSVDGVLPERDRFRERNTYPYREFQSLGIVGGYLLYRLAFPRFPQSTRAAPSATVLVYRRNRNLFRPGDIGLFPMAFDWRLWQNIIVPVLEKDELQPTNPLIDGMVAAGPFDEYAFLIERYMVQAFQEAGLLPPPE